MPKPHAKGKMFGIFKTLAVTDLTFLTNALRSRCREVLIVHFGQLNNHMFTFDEKLFEDAVSPWLYWNISHFTKVN